MSGGGESEGTTLEYTPTWVVAAVCTVIVAISLALERLLHYTGKYLKKKNQKHLNEALQKVKEELMLLGFISLLLTVLQGSIVKICVPQDVVKHLLPCSLPGGSPSNEGAHAAPESETPSQHRRLLAEESANAGYCAAKHKVPLLSLEAIHHLHIFIFVLAIVHVTFSVLTVLFGGIQIRRWKHWEDSITKDNYDTQQVLKTKITHVHQHDFIKNRFLGVDKHSVLLGWLVSWIFPVIGIIQNILCVIIPNTILLMGLKIVVSFRNKKFIKWLVQMLILDFLCIFPSPILLFALILLRGINEK